MNLSSSQAADYLDVDRQSVYMAIKKGRLKAAKTTRWKINFEDLKSYSETRWNRKFSKRNGELLFDLSKDELSVKHAAEILKVPENHIYYCIYVGKMPAFRKGKTWVIKGEDIKYYIPRIKKSPAKWMANLRHIMPRAKAI